MAHSLRPTVRPSPLRICLPQATQVTRSGTAPCMAPAVTASQKKRTFNHLDGHHKHTLATARRNPNHLTPCTPKRCSQMCEIVWQSLAVRPHHMPPLPRTRFTDSVMGATQRRLVGFGSLFDAQHRKPDGKQGQGREIRQKQAWARFAIKLLFFVYFVGF